MYLKQKKTFAIQVKVRFVTVTKFLDKVILLL